MTDTGASSGVSPFPRYTLSNSHGMTLSAIPLGGIITGLCVPDRTGTVKNVVLGFDDVQDYRDHADLCFGAVIGRYAGRIGGAALSLHGTDYPLTANEGTTCLHGGLEFSTALWDASTACSDTEASVTFRYVSPDGKNGFPGTVTTEVTYALTEDNTVQIHYHAVSDKDTCLCLTNHTYFNLTGDLSDTVLSHTLKADISHYLELGDTFVPTGTLVSATGTPFDFHAGRALQSGICSDAPALRAAGRGYDHPLVFGNSSQNEDGTHIATLRDPSSGRVLTITTDAPVMVLYTANWLEEGLPLHGGISRPHLGVALEVQDYPDAMHHPAFPSPLLRAGESYDRTTTWTFSTED